MLWHRSVIHGSGPYAADSLPAKANDSKKSVGTLPKLIIVAPRGKIVRKSVVDVVNIGIAIIQFVSAFWKSPPQIAQGIRARNNDEIRLLHVTQLALLFLA